MKVRVGDLIISISDTNARGFETREAFVKDMLDSLNLESGQEAAGVALGKAFDVLKPPATAKKSRDKEKDKDGNPGA
jgi:hypothetical protein